MITAPALGARKPGHSGVSKGWRSPYCKEMSGKPILGPLPWKSCAPRIELCFGGLLPLHSTLHTDPGEGRVEGKRWLSSHQVPRKQHGKASEGRTSCKDVICLRSHPHCMAEMSKVDTTRERPLWWISRQKATGWTDMMTNKIHNCFETNSFLCKKEEKEEKKYVCLFFLCNELNI